METQSPGSCQFSKLTCDLVTEDEFLSHDCALNSVHKARYSSARLEMEFLRLIKHPPFLSVLNIAD